MSQLKSSKNISIDNLSASYSENLITIKTGNEVAQVFIEDNKILKVIHSIDKSEIEVTSAIKNLKIGERHFKRDVDHFLIKDSNNNNLIRLGQTFHIGDGGTWSSLPHDFENYPESGFKEFFFYLLEGGSKRAIQVGKGMLHDGTKIDDAWIVNDKEFSQIPMGYHPVGGEPDVKVSYIWCYLCTKNEWEKV